MSNTHKDLRSHKTGKTTRKLTPLALSADKITGERRMIVNTDNDISQDDFLYDQNHKTKDATHWHNAKEVRSIRRQLVVERQSEKSAARSRMKAQLRNSLTEENE